MRNRYTCARVRWQLGPANGLSTTSPGLGPAKMRGSTILRGMPWRGVVATVQTLRLSALAKLAGYYGMLVSCYRQGDRLLAYIKRPVPPGSGKLAEVISGKWRQVDQGMSKGRLSGTIVTTNDRVAA